MIKRVLVFVAIWLTFAAIPPAVISAAVFSLYMIAYLLWLAFPAPGSSPPHITIPPFAETWFLIPVLFGITLYGAIEFYYGLYPVNHADKVNGSSVA
jgi:hypothetical protein